MSLALQQLKPLCVYDPRVQVNDKIIPVVKGGSQVLQKQWTTTSISSSSISFSAPPPSAHLFVDRHVSLTLPFRMEFRASGTVGQVPPGVPLLNPSQCALRSYPAQKMMESLALTLNNTQCSISMSDTLSALEHYNIDRDCRAIDYSKTPTYGTCHAQDFADLFGANRSGLSNYADGLDTVPNQGFAFTIVDQYNDGAGNAVAIVDAVVTEPLFLSPLAFGKLSQDKNGFFGLRTMDLQINFLAQAANRAFAIMNNPPAGAGGITFNPTVWTSSVRFNNFNQGGQPAFSYPQNVPTLLCTYITPQIDAMNVGMDKILNYYYHQIERYPTDLPAVGPTATGTATSNNIQLNSIPSQIYVFLRDRNSTLERNCFLPDTFLKINSLNLQWGNRASILASASLEQLYNISVRNGLKLNWTAFSGTKVNKPTLPVPGVTSGLYTGFATFAEQYAGTGSIVCLSPLDIGLNAYESPGLLEQLMLQIQVNYENVSKRTIEPTMYVVCVSTGIFSLFNSQSSIIMGVLTKSDILNCHKQTGKALISYNDVREMNGGNFLSDLKEKLVDVWDKAKKCAPAAKAVYEMAKPVLGMGVKAGAKVPKRVMKQRLKK